ncbi:DNA cytosine methyltransferase [Desnuesiella massiliensis]|uniref:DNA cytosine methyltransferase n=1 Tax=Desnuesiella massiliensis TaxID=1650662 RepID=UPI0006E19C5E|nr:DNA cytosine methyltransferase [Desnuesiella massiliensis]
MNQQTSMFNKIVVDNFAGGDGASTGIEMAIGRSVDIAINHDIEAIRMHKTNHPTIKHYCESVWEIDIRQAIQGHSVGLVWFSPDCKHHSKAKGGKPVEKKVRGLAWIVNKCGGQVSPRVMMLENVEEFQEWCPLIAKRDKKTRRVLKKDGTIAAKGEHFPIKEQQLVPDPKRKGRYFRRFIRRLNELGYVVKYKELSACDYGAPTTRRRLVMIMRNDGKVIKWPESTHGEGKLPYAPASSIIDWSIPIPSIFNRKKPLADNSLVRIARGIQKYVIEDEPYIVNDTAYFLSHYYTHQGKETRCSSLREPIATIPTQNRFGVVAVKLQDIQLPMKDNVFAFLTKYYGCDTGQSLNGPIHTITTKDRFGLVVVRGKDYKIADIGLRMLTARELFNGMGFPKSYIINLDYTGKTYPTTQQKARCGNAVVPILSKVLVEANLPELCKESMKEVI